MKQFSSAFIRTVFIWSFFVIASFSSLAQSFPAGFQSTRIASNLNPTDMKFSADGQYLFVTDKSGRIYLSHNDVWNPTPIIDFHERVDAYNERGLGHLALDPAFASNGWIYVYYTVADININRVARYTFNFTTQLIDPASHVVIFDLEPLAGPIHNAGAMNFAADGTMFVTTGESANPFNSQNMSSLLGKILRINKDGTIPTDNPFYNTATGRYRAIYALGLRNPYTADIQPGTGRYFVGDVGEALYEEINEILPGRNYGWNLIEGPKPGPVTPPANYSDPLLAYHHNTGGCAIVGGAFYNPTTATFPAQYVGKFFYADYCLGNMRVMNPATGADEGVFATGLSATVGIAVHPSGALYYLDRGSFDGSVEGNTSSELGAIWKVVYTGNLAPHIALHPQTTVTTVGGNVVFSVVANGENLQYQWIKNGVDIPFAVSRTLNINNAQLIDSGALYSVRVTNPSGTVTSNEAVLKVTNRPPPEPVITLPAEDFLYSANTTLNFSGTATDAFEGAIPNSNLTWKVDFHHATHAHPVLAVTRGVGSGSFFISPVNEVATNVWFRIYLTAENELGLKKTIYRDVQPRKVNMLLQAPPNVSFNVNGTTFTTPGSIESVSGVVRSIEAPYAVMVADTLFFFSNWGNGNTNLQIQIPTSVADTTITANFTKKAVWNGNGLNAEYFNLPYTQNFSGTPVLERVDPGINFNWGTGTPHASVQADQFSVRWTGFVQPRTSGNYTFYVNSNDGVRLYVNNQLIIDRWAPQSTLEAQGNINLEAGTKYAIRLEYFDDANDAVAQLSWSGPGVAKAIIPTNALFSGAGAPLPVNFLSFNVRPQGNALQLNWTVEDLGNTKDYVVERRPMSGGNFEAIATVVSTGGGSYGYTDRSVRNNIVYEYRIKQTDLDGRFKYSPSRTAMLSSNAALDFVIVPNPVGVSKQVQLVFTKEIETATVQLMNAAGQVKYNKLLQAVSGQSIDLPLVGLPAGTYYIRIVSNNTVITKKLLIQ